MSKFNKTNEVWKKSVQNCYEHYDYISEPRGMEVREKVPGQYTVPMPAYIDLIERNVNVPFMFSEAQWIVSGSNRVSEITKYMKSYANYSDDGVFLRGGYGPKVVDQLGYVVDAIENDLDTRQAVINIWRERPGNSKDIPCTTNMQFLVRGGKLDMVTTMRSNDVVLGFTYDVFTFSMVAKAVQVLLRERGINVMLGDLTVNAGSLHIYERHYKDVERWTSAKDRDLRIGEFVKQLETVKTYEELVKALGNLAYYSSQMNEDNEV